MSETELWNHLGKWAILGVVLFFGLPAFAVVVW